jgi:hypothetical protein
MIRWERPVFAIKRLPLEQTCSPFLRRPLISDPPYPSLGSFSRGWLSAIKFFVSFLGMGVFGVWEARG